MVLKRANRISQATIVRLWHRAALGLYEYLCHKRL
jgi:hypothetical protein